MKTEPFIDIHTHNILEGNHITIINIFPNHNLTEPLPDHVLISSGIHPWYLDQWENQLENLIKFIENKHVIAIGECGLDYGTLGNRSLQEEIFRIQVELAEKKQLPLIVHCVKAYNEIIRIRKEVNPKIPWIIHGFNSSLETAQQCIESGMMLSFGSLLFRENTKASNVAKDIPVSVTFLETDESKMSIDEVYKQYALIKEVTLEALKTSMMDNFRKYFKPDMVKLKESSK